MGEAKTVLIFGAGPSGLCCAHELTKQGYKVKVYESSKYLGGKPISWEGFPFAIETKLNSKEDFQTWASESKLEVLDNVMLPGEHAFRVYPNNYQNLLTIMREIPLDSKSSSSNGESTIPVLDVTSQLVNKIGIAAVIPPGLTPNTTCKQKIDSFLELILFGLALYVPFMLSNTRALSIYDSMTFADLMVYENRTPEMKDYLDRIAGSAASGNPRLMSAISTVNLLMNYRTAPGNTGLQTFNLPTSKAWINPWVKLLQSKGVEFYTEHSLEGFEYLFSTDTSLSAGERDTATRIKGVYVRNKEQVKLLQGDYYVSAIPVDVLNNIINGKKGKSQILRYDPRLSSVSQIATLPATGIQLFYQQRIPEMKGKGYGFQNIAHPWELSIIPQTGYWANPETYAGQFEVISIYIAVTYARGQLLFKGKDLSGNNIFTTKTLVECTPQEIAAECFFALETMLQQMYSGIILPNRVGYFCHNFAKGNHNNRTDILKAEEKAILYDERGTGNNMQGGIPTLTDDKGVYHFLDINLDAYNEERLHLCVKNMYQLRLPADQLYVNNLAIIGAHTQSSTYYVSTMESAAESGRRGANAIFREDKKEQILIFKEVQLPWYINASRKIDALLYKINLPNPLMIFLNCFRRTKSTNAHINTIVYSATNFGTVNN